MVKFCQGSKHHINLIKIGFRSIFEAKRANKYLGKNEEIPVSLSLEINDQQKQLLDKYYIGYYLIEELN